ncbi:MAG: hypothetical protein ACREN7_00770 [Candidatus Dormibacteria bacterium]
MTSNLRDSTSPLVRYLRENFPDAGAASTRWRADIGDVETALPPGIVDRGYPYGTVGTALNWYLELALGDVRLDVAEEGFKLWREAAFNQHPLQRIDEGLYLDQRTGLPVSKRPTGYDLFEFLRADLAQFMEEWGSGRPQLDPGRLDFLCRRCWALALLEQVFRAGPVAVRGPLGTLAVSSGLRDLLELAPEVGVADCSQLAQMAQVPLLDAFAGTSTSERHLDPLFAGGGDVGGADADFIVDGCLIDSKATLRPTPGPAKLRDSWLWQLMGYAALDYDDTYGIERTAIYLARQGRLVVWQLSELLGLLSDGRCTSISQVRSDLKSVLGVARRRGALGNSGAPAGTPIGSRPKLSE